MALAPAATTPFEDMPRLRRRYHESVRDTLAEQLGLDNAMEIPRLTKIVLNTGVGEAVTQKNLIDGAVTESGPFDLGTAYGVNVGTFLSEEIYLPLIAK